MVSEKRLLNDIRQLRTQVAPKSGFRLLGRCLSMFAMIRQVRRFVNQDGSYLTIAAWPDATA